MLSKKDFWHRSEEEHFKNKPASRILIQVCLILDSIIAHFGRSDAHSLTFSTASVIRVVFECCARTSALHPTPDIRAPAEIDVQCQQAMSPKERDGLCRRTWLFSSEVPEAFMSE